MPPPARDPYSAPRWASPPDPYRAGVRAIYEAQANARGDGFESIWKRNEFESWMDVAGVTFTRNESDPKYVPELRAFASYSGLKVAGIVGTVLSVLAPLLIDFADALWERVGRPFPLVALIVGIVLGAMILVYVLDTLRVRRLEQRGIWYGGVFLFPDAVVIRRDRQVEIVPRSQIVRFAYLPNKTHAQSLRTWCLYRSPEGTDERVQICGHDSVARYEAWRTAPVTPP